MAQALRQFAKEQSNAQTVAQAVQFYRDHPDQINVVAAITGKPLMVLKKSIMSMNFQDALTADEKTAVVKLVDQAIKADSTQNIIQRATDYLNSVFRANKPQLSAGQVGAFIKQHYRSNKAFYNQLVHSKKMVMEQAAASALQKFYEQAPAGKQLVSAQQGQVTDDLLKQLQSTQDPIARARILSQALAMG